jgi:hypothetical protein
MAVSTATTSCPADRSAFTTSDPLAMDTSRSSLVPPNSTATFMASRPVPYARRGASACVVREGDHPLGAARAPAWPWRSPEPTASCRERPAQRLGRIDDHGSATRAAPITNPGGDVGDRSSAPSPATSRSPPTRRSALAPCSAGATPLPPAAPRPRRSDPTLHPAQARARIPRRRSRPALQERVSRRHPELLAQLIEGPRTPRAPRPA